VKSLIPTVRRHLIRVLAQVHPGSVDQNIRLAKNGFYPRDRVRQLIAVHKVRRHETGFTPGGLNLRCRRFQSILPTRDQNDLAARIGQKSGYGETNARAAAGDNCRMTGQFKKRLD